MPPNGVPEPPPQNAPTQRRCDERERGKAGASSSRTASRGPLSKSPAGLGEQLQKLDDEKRLRVDDLPNNLPSSLRSCTLRRPRSATISGQPGGAEKCVNQQRCLCPRRGVTAGVLDPCRPEDRLAPAYPEAVPGLAELASGSTRGFDVNPNQLGRPTGRPRRRGPARASPTYSDHFPSPGGFDRGGRVAVGLPDVTVDPDVFWGGADATVALSVTTSLPMSIGGPAHTGQRWRCGLYRTSRVRGWSGRRQRENRSPDDPADSIPAYVRGGGLRDA